MGYQSQAPMHRLTTYIVEDSKVIRDNLIATLQELTAVEVVGYAEDEIKATAWLSDSANQARLVIVDIFLKQGSGLGVLQAAADLVHQAHQVHQVHQAREAHEAPQRKWVVFSNYATGPMRERCLALGADRVFDKSTEIDALIAYCDRLSRGVDTQAGVLA